jgi:transposase-like protein
VTRETCPECGADSWFVRDYANLQAANGRFRRSIDKMAIDLARANLRIMELEEREGFNTQKVRRQEKAIGNLEAKLRKLGERPYAASSEEGTA